MKHILVFFLSLCLVLNQVMSLERNLQLANIPIEKSALTQEMSAGVWESLIYPEAFFVPRYYICGAEINSFSRVTSEQYRCKKIVFRRKCYYRDVVHWSRSNGIRFTFCHFQNWGNQIVKEKTLGWPMQGMKMCPIGQYVDGYQVKLTQRDGLNGLIISCRAMSTGQTSVVVVKDGLGIWSNMIKANIGNFAYSFQVKTNQVADASARFMSGLTLLTRQTALLASIVFDCIIPQTLSLQPQMIEEAVVVNYADSKALKTIAFTKQVEQYEIYENQQRYLYGEELKTTASFSVSGGAFGFTATGSITNEKTRRWEKEQAFKFGQVYKNIISGSQTLQVTVSSCSIMTVKQMVKSAKLDIPYLATLTYLSEQGHTEVELIKGYYRGVLTTQVYTTIVETKIPGCVSGNGSN